MFKKLKDYIKTQDWRADIDEDANEIVFSIRGENGQFTCIAFVGEEETIFSFYSICTVFVPEVKRASFAEFLTRVNYGRIIGNFEMDFDDGEVRYKTSLDYQDISVNPTVIGNLINANIVSMDKAIPSIMGLIYGSLVIEEAVKKIVG
jgi:hypothetical protein